MADKDKIEFFNRADKVLVNIVPQAEFTWLPRIGELVFLPGTTGAGKMYRVLDVTFYLTRRDATPVHGLFELHRGEQEKQFPAPADKRFVLEAGGIQIDVEPI